MQEICRPELSFGLVLFGVVLWDILVQELSSWDGLQTVQEICRWVLSFGGVIVVGLIYFITNCIHIQASAFQPGKTV